MSETLELTKEWVATKLPKRPLDAHKGTFGKVLIIAGSENYPGAAYLACAASYRVGAGLVTLATIPTIYNIVAKKIPEVTFLVLPESDGGIGAEGMDMVVEKLEEMDVLLLGPGLGQKAQTFKFVEKLLRASLPKTVIDGDGLNILSKLDNWWRRLKTTAVLTPHPGEMARLTGLSVDEIQKRREEVAQSFAKKWGQIVVLKGANTLIASPAGQVRISPFANPALATAGTGDVLSGILAGMLAQGLRPFDAACCAVYIHGLAGEMVKQNLGDAGALASDLLPVLPKIIRQLKTG